MNGVELEQVTQYKCLGVILDDTLSFKYHVDSIVKIIKQKLGMVRRIKHLFTQDQLSRLYWGFILPHALYCSTVWSSRSETNYKTINTLHKRAAYLVSGKTWATPSHEVLDELTWPTLKELFTQSTACMMYKCVSGTASSVLCNKFCLNDDVSLRTTRNSNKKLLRTPLCKTQFYQKLFVYAGIVLWNALSDECRRAESLFIFKNALKRHTNTP